MIAEVLLLVDLQCARVTGLLVRCSVDRGEGSLTDLEQDLKVRDLKDLSVLAIRASGELLPHIHEIVQEVCRFGLGADHLCCLLQFCWRLRELFVIADFGHLFRRCSRGLRLLDQYRRHFCLSLTACGLDFVECYKFFSARDRSRLGNVRLTFDARQFALAHA